MVAFAYTEREELTKRCNEQVRNEHTHNVTTQRVRARERSKRFLGFAHFAHALRDIAHVTARVPRDHVTVLVAT